MKVVNVNKDILGGTPTYNGTRVPIKNLFDYLETGESIGDFLEDFPTVQKEQVIGELELSISSSQSPNSKTLAKSFYASN
jgi:uncharacterized protein (DUF433 family)